MKKSWSFKWVFKINIEAINYVVKLAKGTQIKASLSYYSGKGVTDKQLSSECPYSLWTHKS